ncbi:MAG: MBL fold metallo-hydrolase [Rubrivivax sp.]|nr:MBL fold metallo-hydrolase [Rubrivivax sp.]
MPAYPDWAEDLGHGVHAIDTGFHRPRFDAAYLLVHGGRAAFIDTGTNFAVPRLLGLLDALGLPRDAVEHVIPTHVHLDHAGGVGLLMQALPQATLWVHPRGARHLIDPRQLFDGALAVYGAAEMARSYGELVPVPAERVRETADGDMITLAGRRIEVAHTPGHARHHHCLWDEATRGWFTGDTFGLSYREFDSARGPWIVPTTTPVQFEPGPLRESLQRLLARAPDCMYLTHYGRVHDVPRLGALLLGLLDDMVAVAQAVPLGPGRHEGLKHGMRDLFGRSLAAHGSTLDAAALDQLLAMDLELNAQGLAIWLDRAAR